MNNSKSSIILSITLLTFCLFAFGCTSGGSNTNTTSNTNATSSTNNQSAAGNTSPTTSATPTDTPLPFPIPTFSDPKLTWQQGVDANLSGGAPIGQRYILNCPPNGVVGTVYGSDVYTSDSAICPAAVHAGIITLAKGGQVTFEIRPKQSSYTASKRNGVTSEPYNTGKASYAFIK